MVAPFFVNWLCRAVVEVVPFFVKWVLRVGSVMTEPNAAKVI